MKKKLIYSVIAIVIFVSVGILCVNIFQVKNRIEVEKIEELKTLSQTIGNAICGDYNDIEKYINVLKQNNVRVTIIDISGKVLYETDENFDNMQNHINRKEIKEALEGNVGVDIRFSNTMRSDYLYVANKIQGNNEFVLRLSIPQKVLKQYIGSIVLPVFLFVIIGIVVAVILVRNFVLYFTKPIAELSKSTEEIIKGNRNIKLNHDFNDEVGILYDNFSKMTKKLDDSMYELENTNLFLNSILDNIKSGIIALNNDKNIIYFNDRCKGIFEIEQFKGKGNIAEIIQNYEINNFVKEYYKNMEVNKTVIKYGDKRIKVVINLLPINNDSGIDAGQSATEGNSNKYGAVLLVEDVTEATKLEEMRRTFVSNVTHELKTPLTSIKGYVETIRDNNISDMNQINKFMDIIDVESERLRTLIDDILMLSEIETTEAISEKVKLESIIEEVKAVIDGLMVNVCDKKRISVFYDYDSELEVCIDRNRFKQVLINLIDNGIKYNKENGKVTVTIWKEAEMLNVKVSDTGIGIPRDKIDRIFERFYRVDKSRSRQMGGTGLGLAIVKHIVISMKGEIKVESKVDVGTEFLIKV